MNKNTRNLHKVTVGDYQSTSYTEGLILSTLRQGRLTYGPLCKQVERKFANIHEVKHAILCSSGTDALRIALRALKIKNKWLAGSLVIVPSVTFVATLNVVIDEGFVPVIVDVDPVHYHIDPDKLEQTLMEYPEIVCCIPVHLLGQPVDLQVIKTLKHYNVAILEDSCECMFARQNNNYVGGLGDIAAFSLYAAHILTAGVGGIVTTNDKELAELSRSLANHGRDGIYISIDDDHSGSTEIIKRRFRFENSGFSSRMTELQAAVVVPQLETWHDNIKKRRYNAKRLTEILSSFSEFLQLPQVRLGNTHSWMMYPIVLKEGDKWELINQLEKYDIETRELLPLTNQPVYQDWLTEEAYPVGMMLNELGFYIGCHQYITETMLYYVGMVFEDYFNGR